MGDLRAQLQAVMDGPHTSGLPKPKRRELGKTHRKATVPNGYAMPPGTGPEGETCGSCAHLRRIQYARTFRKCDKASDRWTHGPGTDVLARSPACALWEAHADGGDA